MPVFSVKAWALASSPASLAATFMPMSRSAMRIASPMPRVPPVTIATRFILLLPSEDYESLGKRPPTCKFPHYDNAQHCDAFNAVIETGEVREVGTAGCLEGCATANLEFLQRFDTIGREAGRHH